MNTLHRIHIHTQGERFYNMTDKVRQGLGQIFQNLQSTLSPSIWPGQRATSGILHLFVMHTSCALCINEAYASSAKADMETFLKKLAPRNESWHTHREEGPDDCPSHLKSLLLHQNLAVIVEGGDLVLGQWQGIYLAEFRDKSHTREILLKFLWDRPLNRQVQ